MAFRAGCEVVCEDGIHLVAPGQDILVSVNDRSHVLLQRWKFSSITENQHREYVMALYVADGDFLAS